jgi:hypothetical protein
MGAVALLLVGSYLFAIAFAGITLLPLTLVAAGLSGSNNIPCAGITPFCTTATVGQLNQIFITELTFGIICLIGSTFAAFFKFETVKSHIPQLSIPRPSTPQLSKPSELTTEELITELKQRMLRT